MGCAQSKIDNEESVARCKDRRNFMKEAVSARNAFAAAHSGYAMAMKNTGAALSDYAQGEAENTNSDGHVPHIVGNVTPLPPMLETTLPPPPPPLPSFSPMTPLQRSVTMPEFSVTKNMKKMKSVAIAEDEDEESDDVNHDLDLRRKNQKAADGPSRPKSSMRTPEPPPPPPELKGMAWDYFFMADNMEENEENEENEEDDYEERYTGMKNVEKEIEESEPKTPKRVDEVADTEGEVTPQFLHSKTAPPDIRREMGKDGSKMGPGVNLLKILGDIDDHFLKASEAAQEVSKMLEATRMHYHSNFADSRGHIDHALRVMQVITWNKGFSGAPGSDGHNNDFDAEEYETHATVLDKLLAWEKKLYEEVKAGEIIKHEYQRKVGVLNKLKKRSSASFESVEKTKAAVTHLHTKYIVDMQSLDSTVSEVHHIRDDQLYTKLVALVNGMSQMWGSLCMHHDSQLTIVSDLKALEISGTPKETTKHHHDRTVQLFNVIQEWHSQFEKLVTNQKHYIHSLNSWLKLNLIPIESSLREKVSSPARTQTPPIQPLLHTWHDYLEKLPDELAKSAIVSFGAVMKTIILHQEEEMKLKEKCEETRKEFFRKSQAFDDWYQKYMQKRGSNDETDPNAKDPISERQFVVESLKKRLEEEMEAHQRHCVQVRDKSLQSLKIRLPELFRAMSDYSHACVEAYKRLSLVVHLQKENGNGHTS